MIIRHRARSEIVIDAPAKINLFLEVLDRRPDGYHNINSLFQAVSLYDTISVSLQDHPQVTLELSGEVAVPTGTDNLVVRAYHLMREHCGLKGGISVCLTKRIPVSAGLAGGSSDAAALLAACDLLFQLGLSRSRLMDLAAELGSDVPFFFSSGQALVAGRGETVQDVVLPTSYEIILVTPDLAVSTAASYARLKSGLTKSKSAFRLPICGTIEDLVGSLRLTGNDFERIHCRSYPILGRIGSDLVKQGALLARMTGSGPTVFGIFRQAPRGEVVEVYNRGDWHVHRVRPISLAGQKLH